MDTLFSLPPRAQFSLLSQFIGGAKNPYTGVPSVVLQFAVLNGPVHAGPVGSIPADASHFAINLKGDARVRFSKEGDKVKDNEPRQQRPWLQAHPVGTGAAIVRLTSEGRRRLFALNDMFGEPSAGPLPPLSPIA